MKIEFKNPAYTKDGNVNCEIKHPQLGWIPYTASPEDAEPFGRAVFDAVVSSGLIIDPYRENVDISSLKSEKMASLNSRAEQELAFIRNAYPQFEIDTWNDQRSEAVAYRDDSSADTPMLSGIAAARGLPLDELVERVLNKVDHYRDAVSEVTGKRQWCEDRVFEAETIEAVNAVEWPE